MTSQADQINYEYECANGHVIGSDRPLTKCPFYKCARTGAALERFGRGSRKGSRKGDK